MSKKRNDFFERYEELRRRGHEAFLSGRCRRARELLDRAVELAGRHGDSRLVHRALCNRCGVVIEMGETDEAVAALRPILLRERDAETRRLAAYHLARAYQLRQDWTKALFYARIAHQHAVELERPEWIASGHNQIGLTLLGSSHFNDAIAEFERALRALPPRPVVVRGAILDNLGYCYSIQGRLEEAFAALFESLRLLRRLGDRRLEVAPLLSLCYAYQEVGRYGRAIRHGHAALARAERIGDRASAKCALFLLGEATKHTGDELLARRYFDRLQETFYPQSPNLTDLLLVLDARNMVNLKASTP